MKILLTTFCLIFFKSFIIAQTCTTPGQNPSTAFPVCGTSTFAQSSVPICGGKIVPSPSCKTYPLRDINPFWYKFTCFQSGTLGFKITPHDNTEDYDWQLFDITGQNPDAVYSNVNLVIACNWSGESGTTGASAAGSNVFVCEGYGQPLWSKMPNLLQGHEYLLLVSHFTQTQSGYDLSFGDGTAVITDSTPPKMKFAESNCGGNVVHLKLNKKMKCSSIASDGSDFFITPGYLPAASVNAINCSTGFDTDSVDVLLNAPLTPGNYGLHIKQGSDGNTILDYCDNAIPITDKVDFVVYPQAATPMDSMVPLQCASQTLHLIFKKGMLCSSVAPDGSDFNIAGPYPVSIVSASGNCTNGLTTSKEIIVTLSQPLYTAGNFILTLKKGLDGNTLLDECSKETPEGSSLSFATKDTVNADFTYQISYSCSSDAIQFFHSGSGAVTTWKWNLDDGQTSAEQNPATTYSVFSPKNISLFVSNGVCTDSSVQTIILNNYLKVDFSSASDICPNEATQFTSLAQGHIVQHNWSFGDGAGSSVQSPSHIYSPPFTTSPVTVQYAVTDSFGCTKTSQKTLKLYSSCYIAVPTAFTPNGDGKNDFLYPLNAIKAVDLNFRVYNRWGQLIFQTNDWKRGWDGTLNGIPQPTGVYVWFLRYVNRDNKELRQLKGTTALIR